MIHQLVAGATAFLPVGVKLAGWFALGSVPGNLHAATIIWGNTAIGFNAGTSWSGGTAPGASDIGSFQAGTVSFNPRLSASKSVGGLEFTSGTGAWTFSGTAGGGTEVLTIGSSGVVSNASSTQTFNNANLGIALGANTSFVSNSTGALNFGSTLASFNNAGFTLTLDGTSTNASNVIAEPIGGAGGLVKVGSGTWTISGANTYGGTTTIGTSGGATGGTLTLGASNVLPSTTVTVYGGTLNYNTRTDTIGALNLGGGAGGTTAAVSGTTGTLTLGGNLAFDATNNPNGATISGNLALGASRTFTIGDSSAATADTSISAVISGVGFGITKSGAGTLVLSGANTYTGTTTVSQGTLRLDANAPSGSAGTLGSATSTVTINDGSTGSNNTALLIGTSGVTVGRAISVANLGTGTTTLGGNIASGTGTFSGAITLNRDTNFNADGTSNITFQTGAISGSGNLTKTGTGTVTLSGANTYSGTTNIGTAGGSDAGTLTLGANDVLPGTTVNVFGGTLNYNTRTDTIGALNLGGGASGSTAIVSGTSGTLTLGGNLAYNATNNPNGATISGNLALGANRTFTIGDSSAATADTSISAVISGGGFGITKSGAGTLALSGANTYTGATTISQGTLQLNANAPSGSAGTLGNATSNVTINDASTGSNNTALLIGTSGVSVGRNIDVVNFGSGTTTLGGSITSGTGTFTGGITLGKNATLTADGTSNITFSTGAITGTGGITKTGIGTVTLSGSNLYSGAVAVNAGTLALTNSSALGSGTAGVTVGNGATLSLQNNITVNKGDLTITGSGSGGVGALTNVSGSNSYENTIVLGGNATISTQSGTLTLGAAPGPFTPSGDTEPTEAGFITIGGNTLTFTGAGTGIVVQNRIRDFAGQTARTSYDFSPPTTLIPTGSPETTNPGNVVVNMTGGGYVQLYAWANSYTGTTTVQRGELRLDTLSNPGAPHDANTASFHSINGNLIIGDGDANAASVKLYANETIAPGATVTLYRDGTLDLAGRSQTIGDTVNGVSSGGLVFTGGNVTLGSGTLYLGANVTVNASPGNPVSITSNSTGYVSLTFQRDATTDANIPDQTRTFTVGNGGNTYDLTLSGIVQSGSLVKAGNGVMMMDRNNTYLGTTNVTGGILNIQAGTDGSNRSGLGSGDGTDARGTYVSSGATLQLQGGIAITSERLNLAGTGYNSLGALNNLSGANTFGSVGSTYINLTDNATITTSGGSLSIPSNIGSTGNNKAITFNTAASTTITVSGGINTGSGSSTTVTKTGDGTLILSGASGYQGATNINAGVVSVQSNNALGAVTTGSDGTFVLSGAELQLSNVASGNLTIGGEALTISGAGVGGAQGALRNVAGNNTFGGLVTLGAAATIQSDANTLTLSGGTSSANYALTVTGAGNTTISGNMTNGTGSLIKNGTGSLTIAAAATQTATVGSVQLNAGSITVGNGTNSNTLNATEFDAVAGTTLTIASAGMVSVNQAAGVTSSFAGTMAGSGTFSFTGADSTSILALSSSFTASNLTLTLGGGTLSLLGGVGITVGTIHITGNTILDFNNSAGTFLSSAALVIDAGVTVTVNNWVSVANNTAASTVWYATNTINAGTLGGSDQVGGIPLSQIAFTNYGGLTTTWVSGNHNGWFDHEIRPTPEPATYGALLLSGCLGLLGWRRSRAKKSPTPSRA
jgi:autotransporter-associated beta strand protein